MTTERGNEGSTLEGEFRELDARAEHHPGLNEVLAVYAQYEATVEQAEAYFAALNPAPTFTTNNSTE